jgi:hypothetical protein
MPQRRSYALLFWGGCIGLLLGLYAIVLPSQSVYSKEVDNPLLQSTSLPTQKSIGNDTCLECHGKQGLALTLEDGETLNLYVSEEDYNHSVHGEDGYACVQCHTTVGNYPHPPFSAKDIRDVSLQLYQACRRCHLEQYTLTQDSVHADALANGNRNAAICTDCHTAHAVRQLTDPETGKLLPEAHEWIPQTCAQCHNAIYQKYLTSVHGAALVGEGNPDVPTCIDCHGVHNIENPTTAAFRVNSPEICAKCHTDPSIMDKYGISTQVLSTYVADFHGTTVTLFAKEYPDQETNKPVCFDCHGIHDIKSVDDPKEGLHIRENLLARCQVCHPQATANFPDAWLSHYIPSASKTPMVYAVDLFYSIFIPAVLGGMAVLVALDLSSVFRGRIRRLIPVRRLVSTESTSQTDSEAEEESQVRVPSDTPVGEKVEEKVKEELAPLPREESTDEGADEIEAPVEVDLEETSETALEGEEEQQNVDQDEEQQNVDQDEEQQNDEDESHE